MTTRSRICPPEGCCHGDGIKFPWRSCRARVHWIGQPVWPPEEARHPLYYSDLASVPRNLSCWGRTKVAILERPVSLLLAAQSLSCGGACSGACTLRCPGVTGANAKMFSCCPVAGSVAGYALGVRLLPPLKMCCLQCQVNDQYQSSDHQVNVHTAPQVMHMMWVPSLWQPC